MTQYCIKCGAQLYDGALYCSRCGHPVPQVSPEEEAQKTAFMEPVEREDEDPTMATVDLFSRNSVETAHTTPSGPGPDLSGFDVETPPLEDRTPFDLNDLPKITWSSDRPAGWTNGLSPEKTSQMPFSAVGPHTDPAANNDYRAPSHRVFHANVPRRKHSKAIRWLIVLVVFLALAFYVINVNPYLFQNIITKLGDLFGEAFAAGLSAVGQGAKLLISDLAHWLAGTLATLS